MRNGSIYLSEIDLWCDARQPVPTSFVSHAHFDHLAKHQRIITSEGTQRLMGLRLPGEREEIVLPYDASYALSADTELCLYPAGHILGSALLYLKRTDGSFLYTGDFKMRPGLSAEPCRPPHADVVVMETTFGLPRYIFPPAEKVLNDIIHFCKSSIEDGEIPVLFGYSLGKSQELLASLTKADLSVMLHPQTHKITRLYEDLGQEFPIYKPFTLTEAKGHVVICPPQANQSTWLRKIKPRRTAVISGWAIDPAAVYRYQCDAAFPLSDHADYNELLQFIDVVQPKQVFTVHGFVKEFARTLRDRGIEAWALGMPNQLEISLEQINRRPLQAKSASLSGASIKSDQTPVNDFFAFAQVAEKIKATTSKLEKIGLLKEYFSGLSDDELASAAVYFTGRPFPSCDNRTLNCGWALIKASLLSVSGMNEADYRSIYQRYSDSGETTQAMLEGHTSPGRCLISDLPAFFTNLAERRGPAAKQELLQKKLSQLDPLAAKYLIKVITGDLRIGLKEGLVEEGLAAAFDRQVEAIREANMISGDLGATACAARNGTLSQMELRTFQPIHFMLASPEPTAEAIVERLGNPIWIEEKYDGIRCQVHKLGDHVELYSRELRKITSQFPDLVRQVGLINADFIADGELIAWQNERALPFAELQKRLGRKGDDFFLGTEVPLSLWLYDLLGYQGKSLLKLPLIKRRALLDVLPRVPQVGPAPFQMVSGSEAVEAAFLQARKRGNEGLMAKDPQSIYSPGRRGLAWLKLKKAYATLDVVVVGVEWGHGKRRHVLSDYTFAVRDETTDQLLPVGKAYSGLTDAEIAHYTDHFLQNTLEERGRYRLVQPDVILEVAFDTIQPSQRHASGYALRFPRIVRIREDKSVDQIDTLAYCRQLSDEVANGWVETVK